MKQYIKVYRFRILSLLILTFIAFYSSADSSTHHKLVYIFLALANAILIQALVLLTSKYRILSIIVISLISIVIAIEVSYVTIYSSRLTFGGLASMFETNSNEAQSMLSSLKKYWFLLIFIIILVSGSLFFAGKEQVNKRIRSKFLIIILVIPIGFIGLKTVKIAYSDPELGLVLRNEFRSNPLLTVSDYCFHWCPSFFYTTILTISYLEELRKFKNILSTSQKFPNSLEPDYNKNSRTPSTIFIVIGESSTRKYWSLYGHTTPTTPYMDSLYNKNELLIYEALSPACITRDAIPFSFTFGTPFDSDNSFKEKNIISLAKDAGYETFWISNQDKIGVNDSPIAAIAIQSNETIFAELTDKKNIDDINLITKVKQKYDSAKKQLFVIHMRGSHQSYEEGYDEIDVQKINLKNDTRENLYYDRTIHHTDRVLNDLHSIFFEKENNDTINKILFYFSDHGEIVNLGHGILHTDMDQFKIPFIIFGSFYFSKIDNLVLNYMKNGIFNSVNFPYVFSEMIGYKVKKEAVEKAKEDGLYYKGANRKILKFPNDTN